MALGLRSPRGSAGKPGRSTSVPTRAGAGSPRGEDLRRLLRVARAIVAAAGQFVARRKGPPKVTRKGAGDFVTDVDLEVEERIARALERRCQGHNFLGEETGFRDRGSAWTWVVDPIDGTSNFLRGLPSYAVALACLGADLHPAVAAVFVFPERRLYWAARGLGAFAGTRRLRCGAGTLGSSAMVGVQWIRGANDLPYLGALLASGTRIRNLGCSVTQICHVVEDTLDANLQEQGRIWDVAAPGLIAVEAGARFTDWAGRPVFPFPDLSGTTHYPSLAGGARVHARILRILGKHPADVPGS